MKKLLKTWQLGKLNDIQADMNPDAIFVLSGILHKKDSYTFKHCQRVSYYCFLMGRALNISNQEFSSLLVSASFHDVGKIKIPNRILKKQGALSESEFKKIKIHPQKSVELLILAGCLDELVSSVLHHHEHYDGTGYPHGLKGENIPFISRIISVADSFDAMTSDRCYSKALTKDEALGRLSDGKDSQFDPYIVNVFLNIVSRTA